MILLLFLMLLFSFGYYGCYIAPNTYMKMDNTEQVEKKSRDNFYHENNSSYSLVRYSDFTTNNFVKHHNSIYYQKITN